MSTSTNATTERGAADLGPTFRKAREGAGLSVRALARAADISHPTLSRWERGEREVSDSTYEHLTYTLAEFLAGRWSA